jgi:hypothetical protein
VILKVGSIHLPFALTVIEEESIPGTLLAALRAATGPSTGAELAADKDAHPYNAHDSAGAWASLFNPPSEATSIRRVSPLADL